MANACKTALCVQDNSDSEYGQDILPSDKVDEPLSWASANQLCVNIITGGLGTGILTMPWLVAGATVVPSVAISSFVLVSNVWTIGILLDIADARQEFSLGALIAAVGGWVGPALKLFIDVYIFISMFFILVGYIMVQAENFSSVAGGRIPYWTMCFICAGLATPLCFLDQAKLSFSSSMTVTAIGYMTIVIGFNLFSDGIRDEPCQLGYSHGSLCLFGAIANCICVQMCVLPMYSELEDRTPRKMKRAVAKAFATLFFIYIGFGYLGYLTYGANVEENISTSMTDTHPGFANKSTTIAIAIALFGNYPVMCGGMMSPMRTSPDAKIRQISKYVTAVAGIGSGAMAIPLKGKLGMLNILIGASSAAFVCFGVPAIVGRVLTNLSILKTGFMLFVGTVVGVLGMVFLDNYADQVQCFW